MYIFTHTHSLSLTHSLTHTHSLSLSRSLSLSLSLFHLESLTLSSHPLSLTHSIPLSLTGARAFSVSLSRLYTGIANERRERQEGGQKGTDSQSVSIQRALTCREHVLGL